MIWSYGPVPSVCTPRANQYTVFGFHDRPPLFPAGTVTEPGGGVDGPSRIDRFPQISARGRAGAAESRGGAVVGARPPTLSIFGRGDARSDATFSMAIEGGPPQTPWRSTGEPSEKRTITCDATVHLPELPIQYADYSVWQRQWLEEGGILDEQLLFYSLKRSLG